MVEGIVALVDGKPAGEAKNDVEAIVPLNAVGPKGESNPYERHVKVTHEGVVIDIVVDGEVVESKCFDHFDLLEWDPGGETT